MSSATTSLENQQRNGRLKLKIKFSRSKGFVSDFVNEAASDVHGRLCTTSSEPASEIEQLFSSQCAEISSVECSQEQLLSSQHVDVSGVAKKLNTLISKPVNVHQESSNSNSTSNGLDLHCRPDDSDQLSTQEPVGGLTEVKPVSQFVHSSLDNTRLSPEINNPHCILGNEDTNVEKLFCARTEPKQADLPGVNYGKMLQDLEFLSAQQDEPDGRDPSPVCRQKERHMTSVSSLTPSHSSKPTMMESGCMIEGKAGTGDTQAREEASDGEPMSPFDINCSLGFADEDFTFTAPVQNPPQKQNSQKEMKENPLFPWSVDVSTKSDTQTASLLDNQTQPGSGDRVVHAGSLASIECNSSSQFVKPSVEQSLSHGSFHRDWRNVGADRGKQAFTINLQDRGGSALGTEINNNSHDGNSVIRNGPGFQSGPVQIPHRLAFVSTAAAQLQDSRLYPPLTSFGGSTFRSSSGTESQNHLSLTRTLSTDSVTNSQHKLSVFSDSGFSGLESGALHYSSAVFHKRPSVDTAAAERTSKQMSASSASYHPLVPHPLVPHVRGKNSGGEGGESDFVIKLLSDDGTASKAPQSGDTSSSSAFEDNMRQLAENPPSVEPLLTPPNSLMAQTLAVTPSSGSAPNQLNRTIDELRKRVAEKVLPEDFSGTSTECRPPSQEISFENRSVTSSSVKNNPYKVTLWCACPKQDLGIFPKGHENVIDSKESQEKFCRRCGKRTKRKRKNKEAVWCRCDSPDVYLPNGTITELCRKCMKRVSKQWRKRIAAKWCKCHTPVLCTFTSANNNQGENTKSKFYVCKRCQKWISKDREDVCMKGDSFGKMPGENVLPPAGLQSLMTDHNYCQSVASATTHPKPPASSGISLVLQPTLRLEQSAALQGSGAHNLLQTGAGMVDTSKTIVYVFPSRTIVNKNSSSQNRQSAASSGGNHSDLLEVPTSSAQPIASSSSGCVTPSASSSSSWENILSALGNLQNSSATSGLSASRGNYPSLRTLLGQSTSKGNEEEAKSVLTDRKRKSRQIKCPAWLQGISRDLLQPCYVVMEKLDSKSLLKGAAVEPEGPCSVSCRQSSLTVKCGLGVLRQCGHSLECRYLLDKVGSVSDLNRKREYFKKNKTLVGFEEVRQKEKDKLKCQKDSSVSGTNITHTVSSPGFHPLSSEHQPGFTNLRITSQNGVTVQRLSETFTTPADTFQQHSDQLQGTVENENPSAAAAQSVLVDESSVGTKDKANGINGNSAQLLHSSHMHAKKQNQTPANQGGRNIWSRKSRFHVKYYVFGAQDRAFIVPLIQNRRHSPQTPLQLDEEDMDYVRTAIDQLLTEKNSSARHLPYPDSLQHKGSSETVGQSANKKTFVAPTLGGEDLDIEALKSLISDRDFSRLVPRNNRISKSRYLQEIGEKVHMYLTGGCEETPEWIKDVAKSIVIKHRKSVKKKNKKNRLKPSKDVSIEIDYAEEEETLEVDDEGMLSPSHSSVTDGDLSTTGSCMTGLEAETPDQCSNHVQGQLSEADHISIPTGSYVVAEAFAQEEKKPLLQNITEALQQSTVTSAADSVPAPGQQIFVPLPEICGYGPPPEVEQMSQSIPSSSPPFVPQHCATESSVDDEQQDHKPLLGELLVAASLLPGPTCTETTEINVHGENEQEQEQHSAVTGQPSPPPQQLPVWPLAKVKEEPPEEDFSHAWAGHGQHEDMGQSCSTLHNREGVDTIPFISNSTFGKDAVQVEDEEGAAAPDMDRLSHSASEVHPVVKMEQPDTESSGTVGVPMITCIAPGELGAALTGHSEASDMKVSISQIFFSVACAEAGDGDTGVHAGTSDSVIPKNIVEIASCKDQAAADEMPPEVSCPSEQKMTVGLEAHEGALTYGELVDRSVEHQISELFKDSETVNTSEQTRVIIMPESVDLPLISAVSSGEAAKLWETGGDRLSADTSEVLDPSDSTSSGQPEVLPVISSVLCGEAVVHEDGDTASLFYHESENGLGQQTDIPEDENEEYCEDLQGDDDYYEEDNGESDMQPVGAQQAQDGELDLKPIITGDGQILAIPMILPSEASVSETREQQPVSVPQIGVDLSIVKQEPEEVVDFSVAFMDDNPFKHTDVGPEYSTTLPSHEVATNGSSFVEESSSVPSILEVRSLANIHLPSDRKEEKQDTSDALHRLENQSATKTPFSQAEFPERPRSPDSWAPEKDSSQSESAIPDINSDASKITEAELDEEIGHLADEIRESLEKTKPAPSKRNIKKNRKPTGKKKQQQKMKVKSVFDLPDLMQDPSETKNSSVCGNALGDAQSVDSFIPPILLPSSLAAGKVSSPAGQVNVMEDEQESLPTDTKLEPPSPTKLSITSKTPVATLSDVISSDRKIADKDVVDGENIASESDMSSAGESFPMSKLSSLKTDFIPAEESTEPSKQEFLKCCRDKLQVSSGVEIDVSSKDGHPDTTTPAGEAVPSPKDSQWNMDDSRLDNKGLERDEAQVLSRSAAKGTCALTSHEATPGVTNVPAIENAVHVPAVTHFPNTEDSRKDVSTDTVETQKKGPTVAEVVQKDDTLPLMQENKARSRQDSPMKSPEQDSVGSESQHDSDLSEHQRKYNHNLTTLTDTINPDHEKRTLSETCQSIVLEPEDSHKHSLQTDHMETNDVLQNTCNEKRNAKTRKSKRRGGSRSKGRKKNSSKSRKLAVCSSSCVPTLTSSSLNITDTDSQDTVITADGAVFSNDPSSQTVSNVMDVPVLTLKINHSSVSPSQCLSENQVSSSCDVLVTSQKSDFVSIDPNGEIKPSLMLPDTLNNDTEITLKNDTEDKSVELNSKLHLKPGSRSFHHLVQDNSKEAQHCASPDRGDNIDESEHYVSQLCERRGEQGRPCLVLRKKRPAQSSPITSDIHEQRKEKDFPVPFKKIKGDTAFEPLLSKTSSRANAKLTATKGLKRKSDDLNADSHKSSKLSKSERSIFSDFSALITSMSASPPESTSTAASRLCPGTDPAMTKAVSEAMTNPVMKKTVTETVTKTTDKGFSKNMFSRLRASLVSVKDNATVKKDEGAGSTPLNTVSSAPPQGVRERSFFDCLPQSLLDAWKNK